MVGKMIDRLLRNSSIETYPSRWRCSNRRRCRQINTSSLLSPESQAKEGEKFTWSVSRQEGLSSSSAWKTACFIFPINIPYVLATDKAPSHFSIYLKSAPNQRNIDSVKNLEASFFTNRRNSPKAVDDEVKTGNGGVFRQKHKLP